jgi:protein phosphatase 1 regulatory subunit 7
MSDHEKQQQQDTTAAPALAPSTNPHVSLQIETPEPTPLADASDAQQQPPLEIAIVDPAAPIEKEPLPTPSLRDSKGWDGKLRMPPSATAQVVNPEALSDPEYSDEENVLPGDKIEADEDLFDGEDPDTDEIMATHSRIRSIPALRLERFKKVARICLRQNTIQHIEGLGCLADTLEDLDLYDNLISHVRGLDELTKLTSLDLSFNKIRHIKHISHLTELRDLFLVANKISEIENLDGLTKLRSLELGSNRIRKIENLDSLKELEELWVAKNKITEIGGLASLSKLRLLSIQSNRIRDLAPLSQAPQLEELYISHNAIESLAGIEHNVNLRVIDVSNNKIASLEGLSPLTKLEELWASYNQVADMNELEKHLADKKELTTVYFEGSPLQLRQPALYRNKVRLALPQVKQIDATFVKL